MKPVALSLILTASLVLPAGSGATPGSTQDRLRALIRLPRLNVTVSLGCDARTGYSFTWSATPSRSDLAALRKDLPTGADGAARHRALGLLQLQYQANGPALRAFEASQRILEGLGAAQSSSAPLVADYARTLMLLGRTEEAVREARRAAELAPNDWRAQAALARCLTASAIAEVVPAGVPAEKAATAARQWTAAGTWKVEPASAEKARTLTAEARKAAAHAVRLGEDQSEAWVDRAVTKNIAKLVDYLIDVSAGADMSPQRTSQTLFPSDTLGDLTQAARLAPRDVRLRGTAALYAIMTVVIERGATSLIDLISAGAWPLLDEPARQRLRSDLNRLEPLSTDGDPTLAGSALEMIALLQMLAVHDLPAAEASFRQALRLDPDRDSAWDGLVTLCVFSDRFDTLAALCETRLESADSASVRLLLAKAYERTKAPADVLEALEPARRRFPDDFLLNLASAAAILRQATDDTSLARAAQFISRAEKAAGNSPTPDQLANLLALRGLFLALIGQADAARATLERVLEADASREDIRDALALLE